MLAPARTPRAIVALLNGTLGKIAQTLEIIDRLNAQGAAPLTSSPEQARAFIRSELEKWEKVIAAAGIRVE